MSWASGGGAAGAGYRVTMTAPRPLGYWLTTLDRLVEEQIADAVEASGLRRSQWRVLSRLALGAITEGSLDPGAEDDVRALGDAGLVEHHGAEYRLTATGHDRVAELQEGPVQAVADRAVADLSPAEQDALLAGLEKVARSLGWLESAG